MLETPYINYIPINLVRADKAANDVIVVCKRYYIYTPAEEFEINNPNNNNPIYLPTGSSYETILKSHNQSIISVGLDMSEEDQSLPCLQWTPKLHKSPYRLDIYLDPVSVPLKTCRASSY